MKKKIILSLIGLFALISTVIFWFKELTKLQEFDIFSGIEDENEEYL